MNITYSVQWHNVRIVIGLEGVARTKEEKKNDFCIFVFAIKTSRKSIMWDVFSLTCWVSINLVENVTAHNILEMKETLSSVV